MCVFFFKQKTSYDMRISDWSSDVCSSDLDIAHIIAVAVGNGFFAIALVPQGGEGPDGVCGVHPHALRVFGVADRRCRLRLADLAGDADVALPGAGFYELHDGAAAALASNDLIFSVLSGQDDKILEESIGGEIEGQARHVRLDLAPVALARDQIVDRKSTRLNSSH